MKKLLKRLRLIADWFSDNFRIRWWNLVFMYAIFIIIVQSMPSPPSPEVLLTGFVWPNWLKHILLYFGFSFVLGIALRHSDVSYFRSNCYLWAVVFAVLFAVFDEFYQLYIPQRTSDVFDVLADSVGIVLAQ